MSNSSDKTAVIGIGNPLRKDDGIGIFLLDRLTIRDRYDVFDFGTSAIDLANKLSCYRKALLIDGIDAGLDPGQLRIFNLKDIDGQKIKENLSSTHQIDLGQLLSLVKSLGIDTDIYVAGIQIKDTSFGSGLSDNLADNARSYVRRISEFLGSL